MNSPANSSSDSRGCSCPFRLRLTQGFLALCLVLASPACTTVKVSTKPQRVTNEGIRSAHKLGRIGVETPSPHDDHHYAGFSKETVALLKRAKKLDTRGDHVDAAESFLKVAIDARELLVSLVEPTGSPAQKALLTVHNASLARFGEFWSIDPRRHRAGPRYLFPFKDHSYQIYLADDSDYARNYFDRAVATRSMKSWGVVRKNREGYGATLVAIRNQLPERAEELKFHPRRGLHVPVTLVIGDPRHGSGDDAPIIVPLSIKNPMLHETVTAAGHTVPLAADFSAPLEMLLDGKSEILEGLTGFFKADQRAAAAGIYLIEPYDPDRIPVILVHGLVSVPMIWRDIIPEMFSEPDISRRYQLMAFTYPSSYSIAESALLFRESLAAVRARYDPEGHDPLSTDMVVIGHSMGGVLSHILTADFGDILWDQMSDVPLEETKFSAEAKTRIRSLVYFDPDPAVTRAIFIAAPHRGAEMANTNLPNLLSN
ncbi:MAG: esterase/lipase family protein, partial [Verrucomicrobiales bacterium]